MTSIECMYLRVRMDRDLCMRNDGGLATAEQVSNHESVWSVLLASLTTFAAFFTDKITYSEIVEGALPRIRIESVVAAA